MADLMNPEDFLKQTEGFAPQTPVAPQPGPALLSPEDFLKQTEFAQYEGVLPKAAALGAGIARGVTFGLSDVAARALGVEKELAKLKEYQRGLSLTGEWTGALAPSLFTGGAGAVATAARLVSAPVRGVAKAAQLAEGALARQFVSQASKGAARKVLESSAARGLGSAIEGLAYGAGQVVSEAALGDPKEVAENAVATLGVSALLGGALGAGTKIAGAVVKGTAETLKPQLKNLKQNLIGISDDAAKTILEKPEQVQALSKLGDDIDEVFSNLADDTARTASSARYETVQRVTSEVKDLIQKAGLSGETKEIKPLFDLIDEARKKISPAGKAVSEEVESAIFKLNDIENRLFEYTRTALNLPNISNEGFKALIKKGQIPWQKVKLNALDLNDLKAQYQASTKNTFLIDKADPINTLYEKLAKSSRELLSNIDPSIAEKNKILHDALDAQEALKNLGLFDRISFDPVKFKKVFTARGPIWVEYKKQLQVLDQSWGTNLVETAELARAYKELFPKDVISKYFTGRAVLAPTIGGAAGAIVGGPIGAAAGALASTALASPLATELKLRAANSLEDLISKKLVPTSKKVGAAMNKFIPENLAPFVVGKISALGMLERQNQKVDRQIQSAINGFINPQDADQIPTSFESLKQTSFTKPYAKSLDDRIEAFNVRLGEIVDAASDLNSLNERIVRNTQAVNLIAPQVAAELLAKGVEASQFLLSKAPKNLIMEELQPQKTDWRPSDAELAKFERYVEAVENPLQIFKDLKAGIITNEQVETIKTLYPTIYSKLVLGIKEKVSTRKQPLTYAQKNQLSVLFQQPLTQLHKPQVLAYLQGQMPQEQQPQGAPRFSARSQKLALSNLTETQRIERGV